MKNGVLEIGDQVLAHWKDANVPAEIIKVPDRKCKSYAYKYIDPEGIERIFTVNPTASEFRGFIYPLPEIRIEERE